VGLSLKQRWLKCRQLTVSSWGQRHSSRRGSNASDTCTWDITTKRWDVKWLICDGVITTHKIDECLALRPPPPSVKLTSILAIKRQLLHLLPVQSAMSSPFICRHPFVGLHSLLQSAMYAINGKLLNLEQIASN